MLSMGVCFGLSSMIISKQFSLRGFGNNYCSCGVCSPVEGAGALYSNLNSDLDTAFCLTIVSDEFNLLTF